MPSKFTVQKDSDVKVEYDPKDMPFRRLGSSGLRVPLFSLGGWLTLGGTVTGDPVKDIIKTAFEHGINMFDTAEIYSNGKSEEEMGRAIKELGYRRSDLIITSKLFWGVGRKEQNNGGLSRKHIIEGTLESLARLQTDYVDVLFAHRCDVNVPMVEIVRAFNYVIEQGWAFYWATSEWSAEQIEEAHHVATALNLIPPVADQCQHKIKYNYGTTIFSSLYFGLLSGKYNSATVPSDSRFAIEAAKDPEGHFGQIVRSLGEEKGKEMIRKVKEIGKLAESECDLTFLSPSEFLTLPDHMNAGLNTTTPALALAWVTLINPHTSTVIMGVSKPEQLVENLKAVGLLGRLTEKWVFVSVNAQ
ncbi:hypothetical protein D9758_007388 [Tetrapyrgos nigripes]|uniref:NADP-dependent oxidoreductase domain-containing protein n=1 Tax=Tetrapyrgos nigripes TaxID=182062 RepID=A0A8H5GAX6_9AGAR|nr:hypothetical protein D9758_007388 [Tetrapyrgos nigripes]